jgi:uncharacterized membrane protein YdfJ with MMPL/SSD domain
VRRYLWIITFIIAFILVTGVVVLAMREASELGVPPDRKHSSSTRLLSE